VLQQKNRLKIIHFLFRIYFQVNSKTVEDFFRCRKNIPVKVFLPFKKTLSKILSILLRRCFHILNKTKFTVEEFLGVIKNIPKKGFSTYKKTLSKKPFNYADVPTI